MSENAKSIVVAGGCFWCLEPIFERLIGVEDVEVGYAGGDRPNPSYEQVCSGASGHAETLKVTYNPDKITAEQILEIFFTIHDPTTMNRQGPDSGTQYRSAVFYSTPEEKALEEKVIAKIGAEKIWPNPIVTSVEPLKNYTRAEEYHQDYYAKFLKAPPEEQARMNIGYCRAIVEPKVHKYQEKFRHLMHQEP